MEFRPAMSSHTFETETCGSGSSVYRVSFRVNDAFKEAKSHAAEVDMLNTYAPDGEFGREGDMPYIAIQEDDDVYGGTALFMETGRVDAASEVTPLSGKFLFRAKMEYYGDLMYFYGFKRFDDEYQPCGLCLVYPKEFDGTETERELMRILDEAADTYKEELISGSTEKHGNETADNAEVSQPVLPSGNKVLKTAVKTAVIIKRIRLIIGIAAILGILICMLIGKISESTSKHHLLQLKNDDDLIISKIFPDEQTKILDAFEVIIPDSEPEAFVSSFIRADRSGAVSYAIEIDGVRDYDAFFSANSERSAGQSLNEKYLRDESRPEKYYITYSERSSGGTERSETMKTIEMLFAEMLASARARI